MNNRDRSSSSLRDADKPRTGDGRIEESATQKEQEMKIQTKRSPAVGSSVTNRCMALIYALFVLSKVYEASRLKADGL